MTVLKVHFEQFAVFPMILQIILKHYILWYKFLATTFCCIFALQRILLLLVFPEIINNPVKAKL